MGVGQGLVGALANPVSGMLDALSATAEGFNASFGRKRDDALVGGAPFTAVLAVCVSVLAPPVRGSRQHRQVAVRCKIDGTSVGVSVFGA